MSKTVKQIKAGLACLVTAGIKSSILFYDGDHWQNGKGWIGPRPALADEGARRVVAEIKRQFVSTNLVRELTQRHSRAVIGREPAWTIVDSETDQPIADSLLAELQSALTVWWDSPDKMIMSVLQDSADRALLADRAVLRIYLPPALTETGQIRPFDSMLEAMGKIWVELLPLGTAAHIRDPYTMEPESDYVYCLDKKNVLERQTLAPEVTILVDEETGADLVPVEDGELTGKMLTVIETLADGPSGFVNVSPPVAIDVGGRFLTFELKLPTLITEQIRQMQAAVNVDWTMLVHHLLGTGFLERTIFNAQMPGETITDADGNRTFKPRPFQVGQGVTNVLAGLPIRGGEEGGVTGYTTPSIAYREPGSGAIFTEAGKALRSNMYHEAQQAHAEISGDATASGEARKQALGDFLTSISLTITRSQAMIRWLLETTIALAAYMCDRSEEFAMVRANVLMKLTMPPLSADELRVLNELVQAGFISHDTALTMVPGIDDPKAEMLKITQEQSEKQAANVLTLAAALRANQTNFDQGAQA